MVAIDSSFGGRLPSAARAQMAAWLANLSGGIQRLSEAVIGGAAPGASPAPELEFYGEAGAPEGALYVGGQLVGWLDGVNRL